MASLRSSAPLARRLLALLLVLALAMGALGRTQAAWTCEGRVCSPDLARCCCLLKDEAKDDACLGATKEKAEGPCIGKCRCEPSVTVSHEAILASAKSAALPIQLEIDRAAILAPPLELSPTFALLELPTVQPLPPPRGVPNPHAAVPSLRAPPAPLA